MKILAEYEIKEVINKVENLLNEYTPKIVLSQTNSENQVVVRQEQNGEINERNDIVCNIKIISNKGDFEKTMNFHPSLDPKSIANKIAREFKTYKNTA